MLVAHSSLYVGHYLKFLNVTWLLGSFSALGQIAEVLKVESQQLVLLHYKPTTKTLTQ